MSHRVSGKVGTYHSPKPLSLWNISHHQGGVPWNMETVIYLLSWKQTHYVTLTMFHKDTLILSPPQTLCQSQPSLSPCHNCTPKSADAAMLLQLCDRHQHSHPGTVTEAQKHNATVTITIFTAESGRALSAGRPTLSHTTEDPSLRLPWQESQLFHIFICHFREEGILL